MRLEGRVGLADVQQRVLVDVLAEGGAGVEVQVPLVQLEPRLAPRIAWREEVDSLFHFFVFSSRLFGERGTFRPEECPCDIVCDCDRGCSPVVAPLLEPGIGVLRHVGEGVTGTHSSTIPLEVGNLAGLDKSRGQCRGSDRIVLRQFPEAQPAHETRSLGRSCPRSLRPSPEYRASSARGG